MEIAKISPQNSTQFLSLPGLPWGSTRPGRGGQPTTAVSNIFGYQILCSLETCLSQAGPLVWNVSPLLSAWRHFIGPSVVPTHFCLCGRVTAGQDFQKASSEAGAVLSTSHTPIRFILRRTLREAPLSPISQVSKLRHPEVKRHAEAHTAGHTGEPCG